jgi:hypothetical protein
MRIYLFLFAVFIITVPRANAQFGYGPELGVGMSSMHFAPVEGFTSASVSPVFSGKIGGGIDLGLSKKVYFQSGLFVSLKGQNRNFSFYSSDSLNESVKQTLNIAYFDLPLSVVFKTGFQGKGRFFLGLGVTPSYIIGGKNKINSVGVYNDTPFTTNSNTKIVAGSPLAMFDIGVNVTAGYELATGLFFRLYYTVGVNDIGLGNEIDKNRMWGIAAGYFFGMGRNINKEADDLIDKSDLIDKTKD